jgi:hypothetical protein
MKIPLNNDRLSHWLVGILFAWGLTFLLFFFPIFHSWLKVPTAKVAALTGLFCAVQLAVTPWLFSARATSQNPSGRPTQRAAAVAVLASLMALIFFAFIGGFWPRDEGTREFVFIGLGLTALLAIFLVATRRRRLASQEEHSPNDSSPTQNPGSAGH